jgi:hypothetical protein
LVAPLYSNIRWNIPNEAYDQFIEDLMKSVNTPQPNKFSNFSIGIDVGFDRNLPDSAKKIHDK